MNEWASKFGRKKERGHPFGSASWFLFLPQTHFKFQAGNSYSKHICHVNFTVQSNDDAPILFFQKDNVLALHIYIYREHHFCALLGPSARPRGQTVPFSRWRSKNLMDNLMAQCSKNKPPLLPSLYLPITVPEDQGVEGNL